MADLSEKVFAHMTLVLLYMQSRRGVIITPPLGKLRTLRHVRVKGPVVIKYD